MIPEGVKHYLLKSVEGTPIVLRTLLDGFPSDDPIWDQRPDPARFTLREMLAHVADWDVIFLGRIQRTVAEDNPTLPNCDEGRIAIDNDYAAQDPFETLERLSTNRAALVEYVKSLPDAAYDRVALRPEVGTLSIAMQVTLIAAHDGYHTRQAAEFSRIPAGK